jgi:AraC family transcriptional regulator
MYWRCKRIFAELRSHRAIDTPRSFPQNVELCYLAGNDEGLAVRTGAGQRHETRPCTGAICLAPVGVDNQIVVTAPVPRTLHLCLPTTIRKLAGDLNPPGAPAHSIQYVTRAQDELIHQIGRSIISVMTNETAACRMLMETASMTLAARLLPSFYVVMQRMQERWTGRAAWNEVPAPPHPEGAAPRS